MGSVLVSFQFPTDKSLKFRSATRNGVGAYGIRTYVDTYTRKLFRSSNDDHDDDDDNDDNSVVWKELEVTTQVSGQRKDCSSMEATQSGNKR
uniref:Uncharacterized protein n=1 Tax=Vespula pensylvanica TaxID=30213 RepID=A0A834NX92_VESPE|nr:hypothetical protein H0235_010547 [Vespula pensylvanica]